MGGEGVGFLLLDAGGFADSGLWYGAIGASAPTCCRILVMLSKCFSPRFCTTCKLGDDLNFFFLS